MPTYQYRCKDCGHEFEAKQSFSDDPITECPTCAGTVGKVFSGVGISFKGDGFYKNDHGANKSSRSSDNSSSDSSSSTESSSSSSSSSDSSSSTTSSSSASSSSASD